MRNKNTSVRALPKLNSKIVETEAKSIPRTQIYDRSLLKHGTNTSIKRHD